jgi:hypothetical protein
MRSLIARLVTVGFVGAALAGCGGSSGTSLPYSGNTSSGGGVATISTNGAFRFVTGSPDVGPVDIYVDSIAGKPTLTGVVYGKISAYLSETPGPHNIWVYVSGASPATSTALITSLQVAAVTGTHLSVVLADNAAPVATPDAPTTYPAVKIHAIEFTEPVYDSINGTGAATVHHASPAAPNPVYLYAYDANLAPNPFTGSLALALTTPGAIAPIGTVELGHKAVFPLLPSLATLFGSDGNAAPGYGFYASAAAGGAPAASIYPFLTDDTNLGNGIPYKSSTKQNYDYNYAIFAIDAPEGGTSPVELIGAFDPNG